jgi:hypothetical protein
MDYFSCHKVDSSAPKISKTVNGKTGFSVFGKNYNVRVPAPQLIRLSRREFVSVKTTPVFVISNGQ